jgi:hypothetical protein
MWAIEAGHGIGFHNTIKLCWLPDGLYLPLMLRMGHVTKCVWELRHRILLLSCACGCDGGDSLSLLPWTFPYAAEYFLGRQKLFPSIIEDCLDNQDCVFGPGTPPLVNLFGLTRTGLHLSVSRLKSIFFVLLFDLSAIEGEFQRGWLARAPNGMAVEDWEKRTIKIIIKVAMIYRL